MKRSRTVPAVTLLAILVGASGWAQAAQSVVVPIQGAYYDRAAGMLVYAGTITLTWSLAGDSSQGWPMSGSLVATAWSKNTGASYTLYGYCTDCFSGEQGTTLEVVKSVIAIDYLSRPAFESTIRMTLAPPDDSVQPVVQPVAFAG